MSFLIYFFPFVFKFLYLTFAYEIEISRSSHREEFLVITMSLRNHRKEQDADILGSGSSELKKKSAPF